MKRPASENDEKQFLYHCRERDRRNNLHIETNRHLVNMEGAFEMLAREERTASGNSKLREMHHVTFVLAVFSGFSWT